MNRRHFATRTLMGAVAISCGLSRAEGKSGLGAAVSAADGAGLISPDAPTSGPFDIDCEFPGGNVIVDSIKGDKVWLHQDLRDTEGNWFYWYFRVRGAGGRYLDFHFTRVEGNGERNPAEPQTSVDWGARDVIGVHGPAVSVDGGQTWRWLGNNLVEGMNELQDGSFRFVFPFAAEDVRFSVGIPYVQSNLDSFLDKYKGNRNLQRDMLCQSKKGRQVELLHLGRLDGQPNYRVLFTARNHCCEAMANYALEGIMAAALADTEEGDWFRTHVEFLVAPFMDTDGVEDGDQGKNRRPHDHVFDYGSQSIYPSVRALEELVPRWSGRLLRFALDMHDPDLRNPEDQQISFLEWGNEQMRKQVERYCGILESVQSGALPFNSKNNMLPGMTWTADKNKPKPTSNHAQRSGSGGKGFSTWASELAGIWFATTVEIPYASAGGKTVAPDSARALGGDMARALRAYLVSA